MGYIPQIITKVVEMEYCCGCGVCAGICRQQALSMRFNRFGEYTPVLTGECTDCEQCTKCCPFFPGVPDEDNLAASIYSAVPIIKYRGETGYYLDTFVGHASDEETRWDGSSGGVLTQVLCHLLTSGAIDAAVAVKPNHDSEKLFTFTVAKTPYEIKACAKSAYYPVEISETLRYIIENEGNYAITALPCVCKAIRLAQRRNKKLRERVKYVLGLTCYGQQSKDFTQKAYEIFGQREGRAVTDKPVFVCYRTKDLQLPAKTTTFTAISADGTKREMPGTYGFSRLFFSLQYFVNACFHCDDAFAECADATFMDAWLKEYEMDPKGTSLIISRHSELSDYLRRELSLSTIPLPKVVESQQRLLIRKRVDLARVLQFDKMFGFGVMRKRIVLKKRKLTRESTQYLHNYGAYRLKRFRAQNPKLSLGRWLKFHFLRLLVKIWNV